MEKVDLKTDVLNVISRHLQAAYPREGCGVLVGILQNNSVRIVEAVPVDNVDGSSGNDRYIIDPLQYAKLEQELKQRPDGARIVGFFHSHPEGIAQPSKIDLELAQWLYEFTRTFYLYAIQAITKRGAGELTFWKLSDERDRFVRL